MPPASVQRKAREFTPGLPLVPVTTEPSAETPTVTLLIVGRQESQSHDAPCYRSSERPPCRWECGRPSSHGLRRPHQRPTHPWLKRKSPVRQITERLHTALLAPTKRLWSTPVALADDEYSVGRNTLGEAGVLTKGEAEAGEAAGAGRATSTNSSKQQAAVQPKIVRTGKARRNMAELLVLLGVRDTIDKSRGLAGARTVRLRVVRCSPGEW